VRDLPAKSASATFGAELPNLPPAQQVWLINSLAARRDAAARAALVKMLSDSPDAAVRQAAAQALGQIGDARCVKPLAAALAAARDEAEADVLIAALAALPAGGDTDQALLTELTAARAKARARLIASLATRRSPEIMATLLAETEQADPQVAKAAYRVVAKAVTAASLPPLLARFSAIRDPDRREDAATFVEQAVLNVEDPGARSAAVRAALAQATDREARLALLRLLPACGDAAALDALRSALAGPDPLVREAALGALAEWPDDAAWEPLAAIYRNPPSDAQHSTALRGLVRLMNEPQASADQQVARFRELLAGARGDADRKLILSAMGNAKGEGILRLALPLLQDPGVRAEARVAVRKIAESIRERHPEAAKAALEAVERN